MNYLVLLLRTFFSLFFICKNDLILIEKLKVGDRLITPNALKKYKDIFH
jgi:hypothetical protein